LKKGNYNPHQGRKTAGVHTYGLVLPEKKPAWKSKIKKNEQDRRDQTTLRRIIIEKSSTRERERVYIGEPPAYDLSLGKNPRVT